MIYWRAAWFRSFLIHHVTTRRLSVGSNGGPESQTMTHHWNTAGPQSLVGRAPSWRMWKLIQICDRPLRPADVADFEVQDPYLACLFISREIPAGGRRWATAGSMLGQRLWRWSSIEPAGPKNFPISWVGSRNHLSRLPSISCSIHFLDPDLGGFSSSAPPPWFVVLLTRLHTAQSGL